jgi:hypothetical protein
MSQDKPSKKDEPAQETRGGAGNPVKDKKPN